MTRIIGFIFWLAALALAGTAHAMTAGGASDERRIALVVGNAAYDHTAKLRNPRNDAEDLSAKLQALGFELFGGTDLDRRSLVEALITFGRAAETADVALFFYAGHGIQVNGRNYLVPVDAQVEFEAEIDISLVSLDGVMQQMERGSRTNIVFLDACRDNPFKDQLMRSMGNRSATALSQGLGRVQTGSGSFIAFATQPDAVAADGTGRNSPFTSALLRHIDRPGQSISDMMISVRNEVMAETGGKQVPWDSSSLTGRFAFAPAAEAAAPAAPAQQTAAPSVSPEREAYELAVQVGSCGAFEAFMRRYPDSFYAELAREQAAALCGPAEEAAAPQVAMISRAARPAGICADGPDGVNYCATSVLDPIGGNRYDPSMLFDGRGDTAWVENEAEDGIGETVMLDFGRERLLAGFEISNGYDKDQKTWANNSRIREIEITTSDGNVLTAELPDQRGTNRFGFEPALRTSSLKLTIRDIYRGDKYRDTAVSELRPVFQD